MSIACQNQNQISRFGLCCYCPFGKIFACEKLVYRRFKTSILVVLDPYHSQRTNLRSSNPIDKCVDFFSCISCPARNSNSNNQFLAVKNIKSFIFCQRIEFSELHAEPNVGFVISKTFHGFGIGDSWESFYFNTFYFFQ